MILMLYKIPIFVVLWLLNAVLVVIGTVAVPLTDAKNHPIWGNRIEPYSPHWHLPKMPDWWRNYVWRWWRNPTNNLRFMLDEPELEGAYHNPDTVVRRSHFVNGAKVYTKKCTRFINEGPLFWEYWHQRRVWKRKGKQQYFEFRMGWKFSGVEGFWIVSQCRVGP